MIKLELGSVPSALDLVTNSMNTRKNFPYIYRQKNLYLKNREKFMVDQKITAIFYNVNFKLE